MGVLWLNPCLSHAQEAKETLDLPAWTARADSLLADTALRYAAILDILRPARQNDTVMNHLLAAAKARAHGPAEAFAVNCLSVIERTRSRYDTALVLAVEAERLSRVVRDTLGQLVALNSQGVVLRRADRIIEALDVHQAALELASGVRDPDFGTLRALAISLNSKGQIHLSIDELDQAEAAFTQSLAVEERNDNTLGLAINHANLARIYERRGELDRALSSYQLAVKYNEQIDSKLGLAICYVGLATVLRKRGELLSALDYARRALPLAKAHGEDTYLASAEIELGCVLHASGLLATASEHLRHGLAVAEAAKLSDEQMRAHFALASLAETRGDATEALREYRVAHQLEKSILNEKNSQYVAAVNARWQASQRAEEIKGLERENTDVRERARRSQRFAAVVIASLALLAAVLGLLYRQRRLVLQRDLARLEQQRMASQMNPHFLFNALNSIKAELISGRTNSAVVLLGRFANLMRRILNSSIDEEVSLAEELKSARLYFEIENARFSQSVNLDIKIAPDVDVELVKLPPLILQPFLENALLHGLRSKDGEKCIWIEVGTLAGGGTEIRVRDNGIGRTAARAERARQPLVRKSVGLDITQRRLEHFARRKRGSKARVSIHDVEQGGTEVRVVV